MIKDGEQRLKYTLSEILSLIADTVKCIERTLEMKSMLTASENIMSVCCYIWECKCVYKFACLCAFMLVYDRVHVYYGTLIFFLAEWTKLQNKTYSKMAAIVHVQHITFSTE